MKKNELDHIDFEILKMLQANARIQRQYLPGSRLW